jgi:hypothetical protein
MSGEGDSFLSRWSRLKKQARSEEGGEAPADTAPAPAAAVPAAPGEAGPKDGVPLQPVEELRGLESEYRGFLQPEVDESLKRSALKKLFQDPHFNRMDGLDTYIDDYTQPDPIPEAMLRGLNQAQGLVFDREEPQEEQQEGGARPEEVAAAEPPQALPAAESCAAPDEQGLPAAAKAPA